MSREEGTRSTGVSPEGTSTNKGGFNLHFFLMGRNQSTLKGKKTEGNVHDLPCSDNQLIPLYVEEELRVESHLRIRKSACRAQNICNGTNQIFVKFADVKTNRETVSVAAVTQAYRT